MRLIRSLRTFNGNGDEGGFRRWLRQVAFHEAASFLRTEGKHIQSLQDPSCWEAILRDSPDQLADDLEWEYHRELFRQAAEIVQGQASPIHWQAFRRTYLDGHSAQKVAMELGISVGAIYMAKGRILKQFQTLVSQWEEDS